MPDINDDNPEVRLLITTAVVALLAALAVIVWHARVVFIIELRNRAARCQRGTPTPGFVQACTEVARLQRIDRGRITGVRTGAGIQLRFSNEIPDRARQAFRNVWTPPPGGGSGGGARAAG